jgi:hypothetical protein
MEDANFLTDCPDAAAAVAAPAFVNHELRMMVTATSLPGGDRKIVSLGLYLGKYRERWESYGIEQMRRIRICCLGVYVTKWDSTKMRIGIHPHRSDRRSIQAQYE